MLVPSALIRVDPRLNLTLSGHLSPRSPWVNERRSNDTGYGIILGVARSHGKLAKMRQHPLGWRMEELQAVAAACGVQWRKPGRGGSHVIFSAEGVREIVTVPSKRPIKPVYIKKFVALIDATAEETKGSKREDNA